MKRVLPFFLIVLAASICAPVGAAGRSLEDIRVTKEIRVCLSPIHPSVCTAKPEGCRDDCRFSGPAYEAAMAFVNYLGNGVVPRFRSVGWDEQFFNKQGVTAHADGYTPELLASGECDFYPSNMAKNEWRSQKIDFVTLFPNRRMVVVKRSERDRFKTLADLAGKTAVIEKNTSFHTWLLEQNQKAFASHPVTIRVMPVDEGIRAVMGGEADFTIIDADAAIWAVRNQYTESDMAFAVGPTDEIGWAFRKEDKDLQNTAREFFEQQRTVKDSELNRIWQTYYGMSLTDFIGLVSSIPQ
jgi:membrane-bound lytic murein transglycosylase MltF